ncbi:MAG: phosphotransferase [Eubacterium sp.]|nr:phosphotransferase [Eubacterium sp.]
MRELSIEGLEKISAGQNGDVYRLNDEQILKVYNPWSISIEKIRREKESAKRAFVRGIPTAISFDIVTVGDRYGLVYEMINAKTMGENVKACPGRLEEYAVRMGRLLKKLHSMKFEGGEMQDARLSLHRWADIVELSGYYPIETIDGMRLVIDSIPPRDTFIHGDYHPGNIMLVDDEIMLIGMGDSAVGHPVIDLLATYQIMMIVSDQPEGAEKNIGITGGQAKRMWDFFIREYAGTADPNVIGEIEEALHFYVLLRGMAGVTFSGMIREDQRKEYISRMNDAFLKGYEKYKNNPLLDRF